MTTHKVRAQESICLNDSMIEGRIAEGPNPRRSKNQGQGKDFFKPAYRTTTTNSNNNKMPSDQEPSDQST